LNFLIQALWDVALFKLVKGNFPQWNIAYVYRIEQWKYIGILFEKIGNFCLLYHRIIPNFQTKTFFQVLPLNTKIIALKC